jgi:hypothetical protein
MGLINNKHGSLFTLQGETGDFGADHAKGRGAVAFGREPQFPGDGFIPIHPIAAGERDVAHPIESGMERGGDVAADGGFAAAGLAGDEPSAQLQEMSKTCFGLAERSGSEEGVGFERVLEGIGGKGEVLMIHRAYSSFGRWRRLSGEARGSVAGASASRVAEGRWRFPKQLA